MVCCRACCGWWWWCGWSAPPACRWPAPPPARRRAATSSRRAPPPLTASTSLHSSGPGRAALPVWYGLQQKLCFRVQEPVHHLAHDGWDSQWLYIQTAMIWFVLTNSFNWTMNIFRGWEMQKSNGISQMFVRINKYILINHFLSSSSYFLSLV